MVGVERGGWAGRHWGLMLSLKAARGRRKEAGSGDWSGMGKGLGHWPGILIPLKWPHLSAAVILARELLPEEELARSDSAPPPSPRLGSASSPRVSSPAAVKAALWSRESAEARKPPLTGEE